ncbi:MAG: peptidylprolyl isomerase [Clostridia bacterium]|nr:peptidylprolyl isomerase [Clostridia bacterium]
MKKRILKLIALMTCAICLILALPSCGKGAAVMTYKDYTVDVNYYTFWLSRFKANFITYYIDVEDTDEYYDSVLTEDGRTANEIMTQISDDAVKNYLVSEYLCDVYGLKLPSSVLDSIDDEINTLIKDFADGSKSAFNTLLAEYGINRKMLRDIYIIETKAGLFYEFYAENYIKPELDTEAYESFCRTDYAKADFIYVTTEFGYNTDENGNFIYDDAGSYQIKYTEAERNAQLAKVAEIESKLNGENFNTMRDEYNEDPAKDVYPNGYYFYADMPYDTTVLNAVLSMTPGEIKRVDTSYGVYFVRRLSTEKDAYSKEENSDFFEDFETRLIDSIFNEMMDEELSKVVINEEAKKDITIKTVKACMDF